MTNKCSCMNPAPLIRPFGTEAYIVQCAGCGGNLMHKANPNSEHKLAAKLGLELERRGNAFLSLSESFWLEDRHKFHDEKAAV